MCERYTELAPLVAIFRTNMAVEKKRRRLAVNTLSFFNLNYILYRVVL
jgi:hypothetical protein